jgi:hypothetical protein
MPSRNASAMGGFVCWRGSGRKSSSIIARSSGSCSLRYQPLLIKRTVSITQLPQTRMTFRSRERETPSCREKLLG